MTHMKEGKSHMKPRIKRAMLPSKGNYTVYVDETVLPREWIGRFAVREQYHSDLWDEAQYIALLELHQEELPQLAHLAEGVVYPADHTGRLYRLAAEEGLSPETRPFYQCPSPQQYQWKKDGALLLRKLREETEGWIQAEQKPRGLVSEGSLSMPRGFQRWRYYDTDLLFSLPFAVRVPPNSGAKQLPLLIFLHGAGCGGQSCAKPLALSYTMRRALARDGKRDDCILLIPSLPTPFQWHSKNYDDGGVRGFPVIWDRLWEQLLSRYPIDPKRVYLTGFSAGGQGCWNQLSLHPERYAAAVPLMSGDFYPDGAAFERISQIPIWAGHSCNDRIVPVASTDGMVQGVRNAGGQLLRYTRWKHFGHGMFHIFYLHEPWVEWMFSQEKTD